MALIELRLPDDTWRELKHALGADMSHYSSPDYARPNFVLVCKNAPAEIGYGATEIVVIKAEDGPPNWKGDRCDKCGASLRKPGRWW